MFNFFQKTDKEIENDVRNELKWDPSITATDVATTAADGIVTLRGNVPHYYEKLSAASAAQRVGGVRAVANEIEVKLASDYTRRDEDIAEAARSALDWGYLVPSGVKLTVEKGWITLAGQASWDFERSAARDAVSSLMGVCGVTNNMSVMPSAKVESSVVKSKIEEALKRSAQAESRKIGVKVNGQKVTLTGNVQSFSEMEDAKSAAYSAPGVSSVKNDLHFAA
jgi:osmotically-inducible protein OsmY